MLTDEQRRWLGTAIAMAAADGVLDPSEQALIDQICDDLQLDAQARAEVAKMIESPPSPVELASWAIAAKDRLGLYRAALKMAAADGATEEREEALLGCLSKVLRLTDEELAAIRSD
jgi:uncharacterized membrane protein YebE (DUF533 family)